MEKKAKAEAKRIRRIKRKQGGDASDPPETHARANWTEAHGITSMADPNLCARCHVKARDCATCHSLERPSSHTASFRARLHGFHALNNPISCETCHAQGFCEACHQTTEPASHTGSFKDRPFLHCAGCHLPLEEGNRCSVCHRGNPHDNVFALPPPPFALDPSLGRVRPIVAGESCFPCHIDSVRLGIAPRITHPFNTISPFECIQCHKPS
ncbi:hypothetical protein IIC65_07615 [Candidatus Sumerlaeota bacterium]|nr:hypothetical protein [Candidatus Sumerlaeota bacterium]